MPTLSVIAVFVVKNGNWCMFEFADKSRSMPHVISTGESFVALADMLDDAAWIARKKGLTN